jgi:Protein of unknown function (DUF3619)
MTNATRLQLEARMDRFGLKLASHLDEQPLSHDISERLRVARQQALAQRKKELQTASALPLLALIVGLIAINFAVDDDRANELAEVDMQLLTDDLPPAAYTDAGFAQYLKFGPPSAANGAAQ